MITLQGGEGSWYHQLKIMTCESVTYLPMNNVTITNVKEIRFWTSYLPTFLQDVMKYHGFFLEGFTYLPHWEAEQYDREFQHCPTIHVDLK